MSELIGQKVENYKIIESIGVGGMGEVYKAIHETLDRVVALKVIHPELLSNADIIKRFYKEAKIQAQMTHPNIVTVFDFLELQNSYFLVMEYIEGESIGKLIKKQGPQEIHFALNIFKQILSGISHAHSKGIIHRDIKPNNFILTKGNIVKITDFGIAHIVSDSTHTVAGTVLGTPKYMSPEQILGEMVNHRSDIYSLGVSFYEILAGKVPFGSNTNSDYEIKKGHVELTPTPISEIRPDVSKDLESAIARALAKRPESRFKSVDDFLAALKIGVSSDLSVNIDSVDGNDRTEPHVYTGENTSGSHMSFEDLDEYDESGNIEDKFFPQILCLFYREKKTGILFIAAEVELKVYFLQGNIVFLHGSNQRYALAELLVNKSIITKEDQQSAIAFANERDIKIGEALIKMGKISPHELSSILEDQIRKRLMEGFSLKKGKFYYQDTNMLKLEVMYNIHPFQVIYDAVQQGIITDSDPDSLIKRNKTIIHRRWGLTQDVVSIKFSSAKELKLANSIKKVKTIGELIEISPMDEKSTRQLIFFMQLAEFIDLKDENAESAEQVMYEVPQEPSIEQEVEIKFDIAQDLELDDEIIDEAEPEASDLGTSSDTEQVPPVSVPEPEPVSDFKLEINFPLGDSSAQSDDIDKAKDSPDAQQAQPEGEKTKVLTPEEIEQIRLDLNVSTSSDGNHSDKPKIDNSPDINSKQDLTPQQDINNDEFKLEIDFPKLLDDVQNEPNTAKHSNNAVNSQLAGDAQRKFSEDKTQVLTAEEIEELIKLTIKD